MEELLTIDELTSYLASIPDLDEIQKEFKAKFDVLTQTRGDFDFYFTDSRQATLFAVSRLGKGKLYIKRYFDAPFCSLETLSIFLPIQRQNIVFSTEWKRGTYKWVYKIMKAFYSDDKQVFQIPIYEIINTEMRYQEKDIAHVCVHYVTDVELSFEEDGQELLVEIQMDKYGSGRLTRNEILTRYRISLTSFNVSYSSLKYEAYSLK